MDLADREKFTGVYCVLMLIDFEKAFNTVNHNFMISVLQKFNFGLSFINWVRTFYNGISSCVMNNQITSKYFEVKRSVRQGDPLSPYLFILVVEILAINIRESKQIKGIKISNREIKLTQYGDDTTAIMKDQNSAELFLELTKQFSKCSGLKINFDKTEGIWLGEKINKQDKPLGILWPEEPTNFLGIYIGYNKKDIEVSNFRHKISKMKQILNSWKQRDLTLIGKILVMKTLVTSLFRYLARVISFPKEIEDEIQRCMYEVLWNSSTHKVKKNVIIQDYEYGGLRMEDFETVVKVEQLTWIRYYLSDIDGIWRTTMEHSIGENNLNILLRRNFNPGKLGTDFYQRVLETWKSIKYKHEDTDIGISNQYIFYNDAFSLNACMVYSQSMFQAGIWQIKDLFDCQSEFHNCKNFKNRGLNGRDILLLNSIYSKLPHNWKGKIKHVEPNCDNSCILFKGKCKSILNLTAQELRDILVSSKITRSKASLKYSTDFSIENDQWKFIYTLCRHLIKDNRVIVMQFQILHNCMLTNKLLFKMKMIESSTGNVCNMYIQDIYHFFFDCFIIKNFWFEFVSWYNLKNNSCFNILRYDVILGHKSENKALNRDIMFAKYFIYRSKLRNEVPKIRIFLVFKQNNLNEF